VKQLVRPSTAHEGFAPFIEAGVFTTAEIHASERITDLVFRSVNQNPEFLDHLAVAVAVWAPVNGHVCADLHRIDDQVRAEFRHHEVSDESEGIPLPWPESSDWIEHLVSGPLVGPAVEDNIDILRPLVLDGSNLYLTRQWIDEGIIARDLGGRLSIAEQGLPLGASDWLAEVFDTSEENPQYDAVKNALSHNTTVLLGGPGTGKTYTIAAMVHTFFRERESMHGAEDPPLRVALAAPTAKAARQIGSSISESLKSATFPKTFASDLQRIGQEASTIHRLLGTQWRNRGRFKHNRQNHLPYDVVVIDEVSMVSLALMARLLESLSPDTRLVLVGDGEQLKSVENGAVLPEIAALRGSTVDFPIVTLTKNRRQMDPKTGELNRIGKLAELMRHPERVGPDTDYVTPVLEFLRETDDKVSWIELPDEGGDPLHPQLVIEALEVDLDPFTKAKAAAIQGDADKALLELARIRILCGHRVGRYGVRDWNTTIARHLDVSLGRTSPGLPLLNTKNDLRTGLVNGATGIVIEDAGTPFAVFRVIRQTISAEGEEAVGNDEVVRFEPTSLESVEVSFATTVHKAQGSQYETAIVVCPPHSSPLSTRELIYTAATRATTRLVIVASPQSLSHALRTRTRRESGLARRIVAISAARTLPS